MAKPKGVFASPNPTLQTAIDHAMGRLKSEQVPLDVAVKVLNTAIAWEKVKHAIKDGEDDGGYDPDNEED